LLEANQKVRTTKNVMSGKRTDSSTYMINLHLYINRTERCSVPTKTTIVVRGRQGPVLRILEKTLASPKRT
jgi:hypothetical protein